jgi:hypothetical protein
MSRAEGKIWTYGGVRSSVIVTDEIVSLDDLASGSAERVEARGCFSKRCNKVKEREQRSRLTSSLREPGGCSRFPESAKDTFNDLSNGHQAEREAHGVDLGDENALSVDSRVVQSIDAGHLVGRAGRENLD